MKKELRLRKPPEFKRVFRAQQRIVSPHFVLYGRKNTLTGSRLGVSISKSHCKLATRRNRLRRVAQELFRKEISPVVKGADFVITSRKNAVAKGITEAVKEIKELLRQAKIKPCLERYSFQQ